MERSVEQQLSVSPFRWGKFLSAISAFSNFYICLPRMPRDGAQLAASPRARSRRSRDGSPRSPITTTAMTTAWATRRADRISIEYEGMEKWPSLSDAARAPMKGPLGDPLAPRRALHGRGARSAWLVHGVGRPRRAPGAHF